MDTETKLVLISKLKACLSGLHNSKKISDSEFAKLDQELDWQQFTYTSYLPESSVLELLNQSEKAGLTVDLSLLKQLIREEKLLEIDELRSRAVKTSASSITIETDSGKYSIYINDYSWEHTIYGFKELVKLIKASNRDYSRIEYACKTFFRTQNHFDLPAKFPGIPKSFVYNLIKKGILQKESINTAIGSINKINDRLTHNYDEVSRDFYQGTHYSETSLKHLKASVRNNNSPETLKSIMQWEGPEFTILASALYNSISSTNDTALLQDLATLIYAKTGIDPLNNMDRWNKWVSTKNLHEQTSYSTFLKTVNQHINYYCFALILSAGEIVGDDLQNIWKPVLQKMWKLDEREMAHPVTDKGKEEKPEQEQIAPDEVSSKKQPEYREKSDLLDHEHITIEDDLEYIQADTGKKSEDDRIVEEKSTWNIYLKPFLSENWLGLIGIFSLMTAWLFLTMWLWDKGQYFRTLMGAIPLGLITLGASFICRFIHRLEGASRKAMSLFATLAYLSIPFNFAIGISIVNFMTPFGIIGGIVLALVYTGLVFFVLNNIYYPFGHKPLGYTLASNCLSYLPVVCGIFFVHDGIYYGLQVYILLSFAILVYGINRAYKNSPLNFRFSWILFLINYLLINAVIAVYFRMMPMAGTLSILLQGFAFTVYYYGKKEYQSILAAGALSLLGILIGINSPLILPLAVILAALLWIYIKRSFQVRWFNEVIILHVFAFFISLIYLIKPEFHYTPLFIAAGFITAVFYENREGKTSIVSWGIPLFTLFLAVSQLGTTEIFYPVPLLLVITFAYGYYRSAKNYNAWIWFLNLVLFPVLLLPGLKIEEWLSNPFLPLYSSSFILLTIVVMPRLKDIFSTLHKTFILWCITFISACIHAHYLFSGNDITDPFFIISILIVMYGFIMAAVKAGSSIPVYGAILFAGAAIIGFKHFLGIEFRSGLGTSISSAAFLWMAFLLKKIKTDKIKTDFLFQNNFPGRQKDYLSLPFLYISRILIFAGIFKALSFFGPMPVHIKSTAAFLICTALTARMAFELKSKILVYISFIPGGFFLASIVLSLPFTLRPHVLFIMAAAFIAAGRKINNTTGSTADIFKEPFRIAYRVIVYLSIPSGFLLIGLLINTGVIPVVMLSVIVILFSHFFLVMKTNSGFNHVVIAHISILWGLFLLKYLARFLASYEQKMLIYLMGLGLLLFIPAVLLEKTKADVSKKYSNSAQYWITVISIIYAGVTTFSIFNGPLYTPGLIMILCGWVLLHMANRHLSQPFITLLKGITCFLVGFHMFTILSVSVLSGMLLFFLLEKGLREADKIIPLNLQVNSFNNIADRENSVSHIIHIMILATIVIHTLHFSGLITPGSPHFILFCLVPFCVIPYIRNKNQYYAFLALGIFTYANTLYMTEMRPILKPYGLTVLHLISIGFLISLICQITVCKLLKKGTLNENPD